MKNIVINILVCFLLVPLFAFGGSGKGIIPNWSANSAAVSTTFIYVSNISDHDIGVDIILYKKNGDTVTPSAYYNFIAGNTQLAAKSTGLVSITQPVSEYGFGTIVWYNLTGEDDTVAVVAQGYRKVLVGSTQRGDFSIPINNGQPF